MEVVRRDGTGRKTLTSSEDREIDAQWSPDGTKIVFTSTRSGRSRLFVMRANGTGERRITRGGANDFDPAWR